MMGKFGSIEKAPDVKPLEFPMKEGNDKPVPPDKNLFDGLKDIFKGEKSDGKFRNTDLDETPFGRKDEGKITLSDGTVIDLPSPPICKAASTNEVDYSRPTGFREGVRDKVWENAKDEHGRVRDPVTGRYMSKEQAWDMGHKPGYEFRKHQESAKERGISREQFIDEYNNPDHYRPELPSSNRSHKGEDVTDQYFGD